MSRDVALLRFRRVIALSWAIKIGAILGLLVLLQEDRSTRMTSDPTAPDVHDGSIAALQQLKEAEVGWDQQLKDLQAKQAQTLQRAQSETERLLQELRAELDRERETQLAQARAEAERASAKIVAEGQAAATQESDASTDLGGPVGAKLLNVVLDGFRPD